MTNCAWLQPTLERLSDLLKMPDKHNCYGTAKVDPVVVLLALDFLLEHVRAEDAAPRIVPTTEGGLHFEWNGRGSFCFADFSSGGKVAAVYGEESCQDSDGAAALIEKALNSFQTEAA